MSERPRNTLAEEREQFVLRYVALRYETWMNDLQVADLVRQAKRLLSVVDYEYHGHRLPA